MMMMGQISLWVPEDGDEDDDLSSDTSFGGYVMSMEEFIECVACGLFVDYDGAGHPVVNGKPDYYVTIKPSNAREFSEVTEIVWYNK